METKWIAIAVCVFLISTFGAAAADSIFANRARAEVTVACYQAQAEAVRQHVEFKDNCSR